MGSERLRGALRAAVNGNLYNDTQHNGLLANTQHNSTRYAECHIFFFMLSVFMLSVIILKVVALLGLF